jgi:hypothetical protein
MSPLASIAGTKPHFRPPSHVLSSKQTSLFQAPLEDLFMGDWYLIRSSNNIWKDKRNVRMNYTAAGPHIEDRAFYQPLNSDVFKSIDGRDTADEDGVGLYTWQGKGWLRVASTRWEILSFTSRPNNGDWMLVFSHKTIFAGAAANLMCRNQQGPSESDLKHISNWIPQVEDPMFQQAMRGMVPIVQEY